MAAGLPFPGQARAIRRRVNKSVSQVVSCPRGKPWAPMCRIQPADGPTKHIDLVAVHPNMMRAPLDGVSRSCGESPPLGASKQAVQGDVVRLPRHLQGMHSEKSKK